MILHAYHLPGSVSPPLTSWAYGSIELRVPQLTAALLTRQIDSLLEAHAHLADRPVREIAAVIGRVAARFSDVGDELHAAAVAGVAAVTGLSEQMTTYVLDRMAADWSEARLLGLLESEFGDPAVLDGFVGRGEAGSVHALGPALAVHVFSGNVPGVSVTSLIRTLLLKSATLGKTASGEPLLAPLFARALSEEDPELGSCLAVTYWSGGDETLEQVAFERAEAVIAYGGRSAIDSLRARVPARASFIGYGHRVSFGVVTREALTRSAAHDIARSAALAVASFDQQGCVSPHLFYAEEGGEVSPAEWAMRLANEMERLEHELPRGIVAPGEAAAIRQARAEAEFAHISGQGHALHASLNGTAWTVIFDPDATFSPSCLNRLVRVKPISTIDDIPPLVAPIGNLLQTVGLEGAGPRTDRLVRALARIGVSRISSFDAMPWPPPTWHHDGRPPLADLVRWCDLDHA